jgi:hypothetical protein
MSILLFTDAQACAQTLPLLAPSGFREVIVLLHGGSTALAEPLLAHYPEMVQVDIASPRFARLNFDAIGLLIVDLPRVHLESSGGRRLMDALGKLAQESLALAFVGDSVSVVGGALLDGVHAGLSLVPATAVIPDLRGVGDLRALLAALSARGTRLLALDAPVGVRYDAQRDRLQVHGRGSALMAAFRHSADGEPPAARIHVLTDGMESAWPT